MDDVTRDAALAAGGPGWGEPDEIYDVIELGDAAYAGAYMSLAEAEGILEIAAVVGRRGLPYAVVRGLGRLRWSPGPAGTEGAPVHEALRFDRRIGANGYTYALPFVQPNDPIWSRRLPLQPLREKVERRRAGSAPPSPGAGGAGGEARAPGAPAPGRCWLILEDPGEGGGAGPLVRARTFHDEGERAAEVMRLARAWESAAPAAGAARRGFRAFRADGAAVRTVTEMTVVVGGEAVSSEAAQARRLQASAP